MKNFMISSPCGVYVISTYKSGKYEVIDIMFSSPCGVYVISTLSFKTPLATVYDCCISAQNID